MQPWQGLEDSVSSWFDGDSMQSFFEFQVRRVVPIPRRLKRCGIRKAWASAREACSATLFCV